MTRQSTTTSATTTTPTATATTEAGNITSTREPGHFIMECQKKQRDQGKQGGQKAQMQETAEVAEESWLYSWPGTMQEEAEDQRYTVETYEMMNGICEDENVKELNLYGVSVKTPDIFPARVKRNEIY